MSGNKLVVDTNVVIHHLSGNKFVESLIDGSQIYISAITYIELLATSKLSSEDRTVVENYISNISVIQTNGMICDIAINIRKNNKLKLADAIIAATCFFLGIPLLTYDSDFNKINDLQIIKLDL